MSSMRRKETHNYCLEILHTVKKLQAWASAAAQSPHLRSPSDLAPSSGEISNNNNKTSYVFIDPYNLCSTANVLSFFSLILILTIALASNNWPHFKGNEADSLFKGS